MSLSQGRRVLCDGAAAAPKSHSRLRPRHAVMAEGALMASPSFIAHLLSSPFVVGSGGNRGPGSRLDDRTQDAA